MNYNLSDHKSGDSFPTTNFTITVNDVALDLSNSTIVMTVKKRDCKGKTALTLDSDTVGGITIDNAPAGEFSIDEQIISIDPDTYYYDIKFIDSVEDTVKTYIAGYWVITSGLGC